MTAPHTRHARIGAAIALCLLCAVVSLALRWTSGPSAALRARAALLLWATLTCNAVPQAP